MNILKNNKALLNLILTNIFLIKIICAAETEVDEFLTSYTPKEKELLKKFKTEVKDLISHDWQNEDSYLIWWLRAKELDISNAKAKFEKSQTFKKDNKIDGILNEKELINFKKLFPIALGEAFDKQGRPAPRTFEAIFRIIRPLMSPATRKDFKIFGLDKSEWQLFLLSIFDTNQLTSQYGGNKIS